MTQDLLKFDTLPAVLEQNEALTVRAKLAVEQWVKELTNIDIKTIEINVLDNHESKGKELWQRTEKALLMNKERRLPFTRRMDEVKKLFTEDEKELSGLSLQTNTLLENFSSEKIRRKREQEAKAELERNKEIAKIDFRSHISDQINLRYIDMVHDYKVRIKSKYDGLKGQELEDYKRVLLGLKVKFKIPDYGFNNNRYLSDGEQKTIISEVEKDISNALSPVFSDDISEYIKDLLADKAPSSDIEKEKLEYEAKQEEKATEVESAKMDVMFSEPKINEPIELSNGTSVKLEYDLASHNDWVEIIKFWVMEDLPNLMPDELKKKLSFMVTTANRELNKGKTIKGLKTKEAIKIRKTKNL